MDPKVKELGRRLAARRKEAHLSLRELAVCARISESDLQAFETGAKALGVAALTRAARALGVPENSFFHTEVQETQALSTPTFMLSERGRAGAFSHDDNRLLATYLRQARQFAELGELMALPRFADHFRPSSPKATKPYLSGYDLSRRVRSLVGAERQPLRQLRELLENEFNLLVVDHPFTDRRIQAASCRSGIARLVAINPTVKYETTRRVILAHELCHHLADLSEEGVVTDELVDSDGYTDETFSMENSAEEKRARAFAIMLLAPREALRDMLGAPVHQLSFRDASDAVTRCRVHFGIGFEAMTWHLFHLEYFSFPEEEVAKLASYGDGIDVSGFETSLVRDSLHNRVLEALRRDAISAERARLIASQYVSAAA